MSQRNSYLLIVIAAVVILAIYIVLPTSPGIHIGGINKDFTTRLGLDLVGGVQALLEADLPAETVIETGAMDTARTIMENRVNGLGLTEAVVQKAGERRIVVELPGETDPERALATIQQTGLLELVDFSGIDQNLAIASVGTYVDTTLGNAPTVDPSSPVTATQSITATRFFTQTFDTVITGSVIKNVNATTNTSTGSYEVAFELSSDGAKTFADYTAQHVGDILAIVVDKQIISVPSINQAIPNGQGVISGDFSYEEANDLAVQLRYGSLPVPLKVIEIRTVGPTLGLESLRKSLTAGGIGFIIIILFMLLYYRLPGVVADLAIIIFALITFSIFRFLPVTLTLPGIAGFLLSTGSALDANILIFERMKEELRSGKTLRQSIDLGWRRAWPSIRDSNIATLITCGILFWFGSTYGATIVKGFSITLFLGVIVSLFAALVVTRVFMDLVATYFKSKDYSKWFGI
jgi:preprotein translocase subunit SecD